MWTWPRHRVMLLLAAVSVAGLLSMHGLDPVVATVDQAHSAHSADTEAGLNGHGAIGLCVFVAAVTTLCLSSLKRLQSVQSLANLVYLPPQLTPTQPAMTSGPPLPFKLCVLRL